MSTIAALGHSIARGFTRATAIGHAPGDDADTRVSKTVLTQSALITGVIVFPWTVFYYVIGIPRAAAIPTFYIVASAVGVRHLARSGNDRVLRYSQLGMFLILPPLVHIALGGFANSSGVVVFSSFVGVAALSFAGVARPGWWFAAFAAILFVLVPFDATLRAGAPDVPNVVITAFFAVNIASTALINFLALAAYVRARDRLTAQVAAERARADEILRNVLPATIADRLKAGEHPIADRHDMVGVMIADIVGFTQLSEEMTADELVDGLNGLFGRFDAAARSLGVEKVKTIGDAYMAITGAPDPHLDLASLAELSLRIRDEANGHPFGRRRGVEIRIGIDAGPVVAGVIGESRFLYDVYGDTVNTASRMESHGSPDQIQVTARAAALIGEGFAFSEPEIVEIKGKGPLSTVYLEARIPNGTPAE